MKKPDDIKKGLEHCKGVNPCADCKYDRRDFPHCIIRLQRDAFSYIQQLEASYSQVSKALCDKENATLGEALQAVSQVKADASRKDDTIRNLTELLNAANDEAAKYKRERDAAVKDLIKVAKSQITCDVCSNDHRRELACMSHQGDCRECPLHCPCDGCFDDWELRITGENFAWRGVCQENTEVQEDAQTR